MPKVLKLIGLGLVVLLCATMASSVFETVGADEIVVKQGWLDGKLEVWTEPGVKCQCLGTITKYKRSSQFMFAESVQGEDGKPTSDTSLKIRFNDGGHAQVSGGMRYELPTAPDKMLALHRTYHSQQTVERDLVAQVVTKAVYLTGPLMSSKESFAERRADLINYISDQVAHGVYHTKVEQVEALDPISGQKKAVAVARIVEQAGAPQGLVREEESVMARFGITPTNMTLSSIRYEGDVELQIKTQQKAMMDIQTAMAEAKKAEQRAFTVAKEGEAEAAKTKWAQEAIKATEVTKAEQEKEVAKLALETAKFQKDTSIAEGEGQARKAELLMRSNGYLPEKLAAWQAVHEKYAAAFASQPIVPSVVINGGGGKDGASGSAADLVALLTANTARQIGLDLQAARTAQPAGKK